MKSPKISIVIPAFEEGNQILDTLQRIEDVEMESFECLVVIDSYQDSTKYSFDKVKSKHPNTRVLVQNYGPGPANAIKFGIENSSGKCVVITMADGSDDARNIPALYNLIDRGVMVACASRYMPGGQQVGGPRFKKFLSKSAGKILYHLAGVDTHDPTNSFKAYSAMFLRMVDIESTNGFEIGIELVAKARRLRLPIAEIPTIWLDRTIGKTNFKIAKWLPKYLKWFFFAFGGKQNSKIHQFNIKGSL